MIDLNNFDIENEIEKRIYMISRRIKKDFKECIHMPIREFDSLLIRFNEELERERIEQEKMEKKHKLNSSKTNKINKDIIRMNENELFNELDVE